MDYIGDLPEDFNPNESLSDGNSYDLNTDKIKRAIITDPKRLNLELFGVFDEVLIPVEKDGSPMIRKITSDYYESIWDERYFDNNSKNINGIEYYIFRRKR